MQPLDESPVPMVRPALPESARLLGHYARLLESGQLTNGETVRAFEQAAARYLGVPECVAVSSCTSGLMLVERCLGLRGRVIVPSFTFFATAHSLLWNSLEPVLVDCDPETWNLDPAAVRRALERIPDISGMVAVHTFGNPAPMEELEAIARDAGVRLIFDSAHGFGARREGRPVGRGGDAEVFSLSPTKLLVAGEGGLIATSHPDLARSLRAARNYGDAGDYDCRELGLNARMTEFQAALGLASLELVEGHVEGRERVARVYERCLGAVPGVTLQKIRPQDRSARKDFTILVEGAGAIQAALAEEQIQTRRYFDPPLHRQRLYRRFYRPEVDPLLNTTAISRRVLSLPIYPRLEEREVERIARLILQGVWRRASAIAGRSSGAARASWSSNCAPGPA
jgi:dTDP-4-amino-4,6-dideoxygalactose transaminase